MKYVVMTQAVETALVNSRDLDKIRHSDHLTNSAYGYAPEQIIYDGGLDYKENPFTSVEQRRAKGQFIIQHGGQRYRYVVRGEPGTR